MRKIKRGMKYNYFSVKPLSHKATRQESHDAWNLHVNQNESIILDLFHGQFRFRTSCANPKCKKESVTYGPFTYVSLPVPVYQYVTLDLFYVQYYINDMYYNEKLQIVMRDDMKICDLRTKIEKKYGFA